MSFSELNTADATQSRLWKGYGKSARKQGQMTGIYRPVDNLSPFSNMIGVLPVIYANNYGFKKPNKFGISTFLAIFDANNVKEGDYLVTPPFSFDEVTDENIIFTTTGIPPECNVFYVASLNIYSPIVVVSCERTVTVSRIIPPVNEDNQDKGVTSYSGIIPEREDILMKDFRASILQGTKGENNPTNLPLDIRMPWWTILMPYMEGIYIDTGDFIKDDLGKTYVVSSAELTQMGWRLVAAYERA